MIQSTDPERLSNKEGSCRWGHGSSWEGEIDFAGKMGVNRDVNSRVQDGTRWRERVLGERTGIGGHLGRRC